LKELVTKNLEMKERFKFIDKSLIIKIIFMILITFISFWLQKTYYKPNFGIFLSSDMDTSGNVYILSVIKKSKQYKITKVSNKGTVIFEKNLEKGSDSELYSYSNLDVDSKGNIFLVREVRDLKAVVSNPSLYPVSKEIVKMYSNKGEEIKQVALFDFASVGKRPVKSYVKKIQILNQKMTIICSQGYNYDIISVNPYLDESPDKEFSFNVGPPVSDSKEDLDWVNDISVLSNGKIFYSTKRGNLFLVDRDGISIECRSLLPNRENSITSMCVDRMDNLYFTDLRTGNFYKMDTSSMSVSRVFAIGDPIKINDLRIRDLRRIRAINENDFYASSKTFVNPFHVRIGNNTNIVSDIRYSFWPYGLILSLAGVIFISAILAIIRIFKKSINRILFAIKVTALFLPIFTILMSLLIIFSTNKALNAYTNVLRQNQTIGSKIISEKIDGNSLLKMLDSANYMSHEFAIMRNAIHTAYLDVKDKVGDSSDYAVIYVSDGSKIYSITNSKYSGDYKYYDELKFADPDMTQEKIAIADSLLEADEIENIYAVWSRLKDGEKKSEITFFRDVHGDLSASFVPIRNSSGSVVGMVGNFLDEKTHVKNKFFEILIKSSTLIGIISLLIFVYLCFVIWILLRPLRNLNYGIESMINGNWKTRIKIQSRDEFADIAIAFNDMSDKLETYTDNLIDLNQEYLKFVPKELLNLMDKEKITQVKSGEGKISEISILYITFNIGSVRDISNNFETVLFSCLQNSYSKILKIVETNNGIIQNFSSLGTIIIFPKNPKNAISASFQIFESDVDNRIKQNMRIGIGFGDVLIGVIGDDVRRGVSIISDEIFRLIKIDKGIKKLGIKLVATEFIVDKIEKDFSILLRFVGKFKDISSPTWIKLYEIIDSSYDNHRRELNIKTKNIFERAVNLYIDSNFSEARKLFVDVLKQNDKDSAALYYIGMCDIMLNHTEQKNNLKEFVGEIFQD